ncbi:hypothetical protein [Chitinivorax sp. B]|uniref:hypothetical protein n=1 Tax=Chitinivorax sp. B TaxID=2502235 RepID=UPI0010F64F1D|nr:hypothetical protein [Chitinivorax sp. B]
MRTGFEQRHAVTGSRTTVGIPAMANQLPRSVLNEWQSLSAALSPISLLMPAGLFQQDETTSHSVAAVMPPAADQAEQQLLAALKAAPLGNEPQQFSLLLPGMTEVRVNMIPGSDGIRICLGVRDLAMRRWLSTRQAGLGANLANFFAQAVDLEVTP